MNESSLSWQSRYELGIPSIDHEHREMVEAINRLVARIDEGTDTAFISAALGDILSGISAHFALEEKLMRDRQYDQYFDHKADHDRLVDQLRDIMDDFELHGRIRPSELVRALDEWFSEHFRTCDARLHRLAPAQHEAH
jgi:hemerythrin-like metal-binding protein